MERELETVGRQLEQYEQALTSRLREPLPKDSTELENLVIQHKEFENNLQAMEPQVEAIRLHYQQISPQRRSRNVETKMANLSKRWDQTWGNSHSYVER